MYDPGCDLWSVAPDVLASAIGTLSSPAQRSYEWDLSTCHGHLCFLFPKGSSRMGRVDLDEESMVVEDGPGYRMGATVAETDGYIYMMGGENEEDDDEQKMCLCFLVKSEPCLSLSDARTDDDVEPGVCTLIITAETLT